MTFPVLIQELYTDGACSGNPGPGGWGTVAYFADGSVHELGGADPDTTNNRMEMQAAIAALDLLLASGQQQSAVLHTDSEYVKNGITKWVKGWKKKGWKTSAGKAVLNQDLWEQMDDLHQQVNRTLSMPLAWKYVRGHSGNPGNERCDQIARAFSERRSPQLTQQPWAMSPTDNTEMDPKLASPKQRSAKLQPVIKGSADTKSDVAKTLQSIENTAEFVAKPQSLPVQPMADSPSSSLDGTERYSSEEERLAQLRNMVETLRMADEVAQQGYLITSAELADLMDVNASAVTSRGDNWVWRNWVVSRVRREGNQILWQLERVDA